MTRPNEPGEMMAPPKDPEAFRELPYFYACIKDSGGVPRLHFYRKNSDGTRGEEFFPDFSRRSR